MNQTARINGACYGLMLLLGCHIAVLQSLLERITSDLSFSITAAGSLVTFDFLGVLLGPLLTGELGDRFGRKPILLTGLGLYVAAVSLMICARSYALMAVAILLVGVAFAICESTVTSLLSDENENGNRALNMSQSFLSLGAVIGPFFALGMLTLPTGWRGMLGLLIVLFAAALFLFIRTPIPRRVSAAREKAVGASSLSMLRRGYFLLMCLAMFVYVGVETTVTYWMDMSFVHRLNQPDLGKVALALFWGGTIVGRLFGSRVTRFADPLLLGGLALSTLSLATVPLTVSPAANVVCFGLAGLGFSTVWPSLMAKALAAYPEARGATVGLLFSFCGLGGMALPFVMGLASDHLGFGLSLWLLPASAAAVALLSLPLVRRFPGAGSA